MNEIRSNTLKKQITAENTNTVILSYEIEYPVILRSNYRLGRIVFNTFNRYLAFQMERYANGELLEEAKKTYEFNKEHGYPTMEYELINKYHITFNEKKLVSLYADKYMFTGGAHGITERNSQNWNLETGTQIPLSNYFIGEDYKQRIIHQINKQIKKQIANGENFYFEDYEKLVAESFDPKHYYRKGNNIVIFFQQYEIAPYSSGIPTFSIPIEKNRV